LLNSEEQLEKKPENTKQSNMDAALKVAKEEFARRDPKEMAEMAGGEYESASCSNSLISLRLLGQEYTLVHPGGGIESPDHHQVGLEIQYKSRPSPGWTCGPHTPASLPHVRLRQTSQL